MTAGDEREAHPFDAARAEAAVAELLEALGYDPRVERLARTPERVAAAFAAVTRPDPLPPVSLMPVESDGPVVVRDLPFQSLCEHHLLPFHGVAHVGYLPGEGMIGLSTIARLVTLLASDLQLQERLTERIADELERMTGARGVGVVLEAEHLCMSLRGFGSPHSRVSTSVFRGELRSLAVDGEAEREPVGHGPAGHDAGRGTAGTDPG